MKPIDILEKLKSDSTPKVQATLQSIYQVCIEQQKRGVGDFSIATIARLGNMRGVPRAQSIRNKSGEKYRILIDSFSINNPSTKPLKSRSSEEDWVEEIPNPKHRLLVRILSSELREARKLIQEIIPPKTRIDVYDHGSTLPVEINLLDPFERQALEYILSKEFLTKWQLTASSYGEYLDSSGKSVFKVATVQAIRKALEHL